MTPAARGIFGFLNAGGLPIFSPDAAWIVVGWGARDFYMTTGSYADLQAGPVWRAMTGDASVMRVLVAGQLSDDTGITWIGMSSAQFDTLLAQIRASFVGDVPRPLVHPGLNGRDLFYPATGHFHLLRTCNVWVGDVLRRSGVPVGIWTPFTWSLP